MDSGRKTYQVEQLGRIELASWMTQQSEPAQLRDDLMVRLRAEAQLGNNQILPELLRHLGLHQEKLKLYQNIYDKDFKDSDDLNNRVLYIHKMILELGITMETEWIKWLEQVIPQLKLLLKITHLENNHALLHHARSGKIICTPCWSW